MLKRVKARSKRALSRSKSSHHGQSGHSRLVEIVCKNPRCRKTFESLHAYNQHRRHPSNKGTQCSSLLCMGEIVVDARRNVGTAILRREDSPAMQGTFDYYSCLFMKIFQNNLK